MGLCFGLCERDTHFMTLDVVSMTPCFWKCSCLETKEYSSNKGSGSQDLSPAFNASLLASHGLLSLLVRTKF